MSCKLVADDYGMSIGINHAISELAGKNIISKVSVMANEQVECSANDLGKTETGLHINLLSYVKGRGIVTDRQISPLKFLYLIYIRRIDAGQIADNINRQIEALELRGFKASYMDTHQHVHILPAVLDAMIACARQRKINSMRCITMERRYLFFYLFSLLRFGFFAQAPKMIFLYAAGVLMKLKLNKAEINYCKNLILMPLAGGGDYQGLLRRIVNKFKGTDAEIVTHPGLETGGFNPDDYTGRDIEYNAILRLAD